MRLNKIKNLYLRRAYLCLVVLFLTFAIPVAALIDLLRDCVTAQWEAAKDVWKDTLHTVQVAVEEVGKAWKAAERR